MGDLLAALCRTVGITPAVRVLEGEQGSLDTIPAASITDRAAALTL
jgi:hypothetical protein